MIFSLKNKSMYLLEMKQLTMVSNKIKFFFLDKEVKDDGNDEAAGSSFLWRINNN